ncbi:MAG: hypothetical protein ACJ780_16870 [Solirubrobacteraceae bacterium]
MAEFGPVTCAGCGLVCDDVTVTGSDDAVRLQPPCGLGAAWFSQRMGRPPGAPATIDGRPADVDTALRRAAELLRHARRPLLHGFDGATVEDARAAVALADRVGGLISAENVGGPWPGVSAVAQRGASTATLGEIRDRSHVVVIWREDPESTHPRLLQRLGFDDADTPSRVSAERTLVVVEDRETATAERADVRLRWARERDLDALITMHALERGLTLEDGDPTAERHGLQALKGLHGLLERITAVPHVSFVHGPALTSGAGGQRRALALHELVRALSHDRHVVTLALPAAAGTTGAQDVLAWQTGYGGIVDLASGHPEPVTTTRPLLSEDDIDLSLRIEGGSARLPAGVAEIALCSRPLERPEPDTTVSIRTAAAGVEARGTVHRLDGVPLALQAPLAGDAPTAAALLERLLDEVAR